MTLHDLLLDYDQTYVPTLRSARSEHWRVREMAEHFGTATELTAHAVREFRDTRLKTVSPATVRRYLARLRHAVRWGRAERDAAFEWPDVTFPTESRPRDRLISDSEFDAVLRKLHGTARPAVLVLEQTGCRRGELLAARAQDLDGRFLTLRHTKSGRPRRIPLTTRAAELLALQARDKPRQARLFDCEPDHVSHQWQHAVRAARVPHARLHDLRGRAASRFLQDGLSVAEVMHLGGWSSPATLLRVYARMDATRLLDKLA